MNLRDESMQMWISDPFIWSVSFSRSFSLSRSWRAHLSGLERIVTSRVTVSREGNTKASSEERSSQLHMHFHCFTFTFMSATDTYIAFEQLEHCLLLLELWFFSGLSLFGTEEKIWSPLSFTVLFFRISSFVLNRKKQVLQVWNVMSVSK